MASKKHKSSHALVAEQRTRDFVDGCAYFAEGSRWAVDLLAHKHNLLVPWERTSGYIEVCVGHILGLSALPMYAKLYVDVICGYRVCVYYAASRYADWDLLDEWVDNNFICDGVSRTDFRLGFSNMLSEMVVKNHIENKDNTNT